MKRRAFTLVELMIVTSILGILAAIVLPMFQDHARLARESAAKDMLRAVRSQIELYKLDHNGLLPGYYLNPIGVMAETTTEKTVEQFTCTTDIKGISSATTTKSGAYTCGPYFMKMPVNPFNDLRDIKYVTDFAAEANKTTGWLYKKSTGEFKLNWTGTDSKGVNYLDY